MLMVYNTLQVNEPNMSGFSILEWGKIQIKKSKGDLGMTKNGG